MTGDGRRTTDDGRRTMAEIDIAVQCTCAGLGTAHWPCMLNFSVQQLRVRVGVPWEVRTTTTAMDKASCSIVTFSLCVRNRLRSGRMKKVCLPEID